MNNDDFTVLVSGGGRLLLSELVYSVAIAFKMTEQVEQLICIKFYDKLEHSSVDTNQKAFRDDAMNEVQIKMWHRCFKDGRESVESGPHPGSPATSRTPANVKCVWAAINKDQRLTVRELEADLGIPKATGFYQN